MKSESVASTFPCPQIGIDINHPDFYQKHKRSETDAFYDCMKNSLQPDSGIPVFGHAGSPGRTLLTALNQGNNAKASIQPVLDYQKNLWRQVSHKEKTPGAAQETWMNWITNVNLQQANVDATNAADDDAARAARQQNMQLQQMQQQQFMQNSISQGSR